MVQRTLIIGGLFSLAACPLQLDIGDNESPQDPGETTADTPDPGGSTTDDPTTGEPAGDVCGDGVVAGDEVCDDGNAEPNDGCDAACARTGTTLWDRPPLPIADPHGDIAVHPDGRIIAVGGDVVLFLSPEGEPLQASPLSDEFAASSVVVGDDGGIYVGGWHGRVAGLDAAGIPQWEVGEPFDPDSSIFREIAGVTFAGGSLYATLHTRDDGDNQQYSTALRRLDPATGDLLAEAEIPSESGTRGLDVAADATRVVVTGFERELLDEFTYSPHGLVAAFDLDLALQSVTVDPQVGWVFSSIAADGEGGFILAGSSWHNQATVRRLGPDLSELWTRSEAAHDGIYNSVARGPGGEFVLAGALDVDDFLTPIVRRIAGDGAPLWTSLYPSAHVWALDQAFAVAAGPDFVVALGGDRTEPEWWWSPWVRCYAPQ